MWLDKPWNLNNTKLCFGCTIQVQVRFWWDSELETQLDETTYHKTLEINQESHLELDRAPIPKWDGWPAVQSKLQAQYKNPSPMVEVQELQWRGFLLEFQLEKEERGGMLWMNSKSQNLILK